MKIRLILAALTGCALCSAYVFPQIGAVAVLPLLLALSGANAREAFYIGLVCGVFEASGHLGVLHGGMDLFAPLTLLFALFRMIFCLAYVGAAKRSGPVLTTLLAPALWTLVEVAHASLPHTLPPLLGDTQFEGPFLPLARLGGTYLISFQLVWIAAWLAVVITCAWGDKKLYLQVGWATALLLTTSTAVGLQARPTAPLPTPETSVSLIQGGLPRWLYDRALVDSSWKQVPLKTYAALTQQAARTDLTIWPETATNQVWGEDPDYEQSLRELSKNRGSMLVGTIRHAGGPVYYNSALLIEPDHIGVADKKRLGLNAEMRFTIGNRSNVVQTSVGRVGIVFCLESVIPSYSRELVSKHQAEIITVLADGGIFKRAPIARVHALRSIIRAVETGRWVLHAGQNGFTTVISPHGEFSPLQEPFTAGAQHATIHPISDSTPYTRWGNLIVVPACLLWLLGLIVSEDD